LKKNVAEITDWGISHRTQWENLKAEVEKKKNRTTEFKKHKKHIIHDCKEALHYAEELADNIPFYSVGKTKEAVRKVRTLRKLSCVYDIDQTEISSSSEECLLYDEFLDCIPSNPYTPTQLVGTELTDVTCAYVQTSNEPSAPPLSLS
jgi:hypothetical protein